MAELAEFFELLMVLCFGISWPISIIKTLKTKCVSGKSPLFIMFIISVSVLLTAETSRDVSENTGIYPVESANFQPCCLGHEAALPFLEHHFSEFDL